ncbi:hypothetical protein K469DRAFT_746883 [Zopfia rhizophila CBS 207.26]|uniref:Cytochrome P450 n=1 Tax=Zopfia rhizophila CBS 207.26 TaxID=1314779 RepID=A0A6A6EKC3_9PEZI|nr:hypothetical protein K469DRAFT_746883 [Zopfia rhizophila CBS 207.26]
MPHTCSMESVKDMEPYLDSYILALKEKIAHHAARSSVFNLKKLLRYYVVNVLYELAFSHLFGVQDFVDYSWTAPVKEHIILGSATGAWSSPYSKKWLPKILSKRIQALFNAHRACVELASESCKILLTSLILAKHPNTSASLTRSDLETDAFGCIIAGTHTTTATTTPLSWRLLHNPSYMGTCIAEIDSNPTAPKKDVAYSVTAAESCLPFLRKLYQGELPHQPRLHPATGYTVNGS